jgi:hypothetical protein
MPDEKFKLIPGYANMADMEQVDARRILRECDGD